MEKYYLCNDIRFLSGMGEKVISPSSGTHLKQANALGFLKTHPGYEIYKARTTSKRNDYVISTPMKFVGNGPGNIVDTIQRAKVFSSPDAAFEYLEKCRSEIPQDICYVIDEKFTRKKCVIKEKIVDPMELYDATHATSERIVIPQWVRGKAYQKSNGICEICGRPLYEHMYTIDHILPLSCDGTNVFDNLRATHGPCNQLKGNFLDKELFSLVNTIACNNIFKNPESNFAVYFMRSFIRGVNNKHGFNDGIETKNEVAV